MTRARVRAFDQGDTTTFSSADANTPFVFTAGQSDEDAPARASSARDVPLASTEPRYTEQDGNESTTESQASPARTPFLTPQQISTAGDFWSGIEVAFSGVRLSSPSLANTSTSLQNTGSGGHDSALNMRSLDAALPTVTSSPQPSRRGPLGSPENISGRLLSPDSQRGDLTPSMTPRSRHLSASCNPERHEVRDEELPRQRYHEPAFQQALSDSQRLVSELTGILSTSTSSLHSEPDSTMKKLYMEAQDLSVFDCPAKRTVGFVGDTGVGKSSLINCLLDTKNLARTSGGGGACTCVATEYHYHARDDFVIEVEWFSDAEIRAQLEDLLDAYRHYHLGLEPDATSDDLGNWEERANVAHHTFEAMFRNHLRVQRDRDFLRGDDKSEVMAKLEEWLEERDFFDPESRSEAYPSAVTCSDRLMELTSELPSSQDPSIWPFIRKIILRTNAHILSKGLVLVDLPGLRDLNSARQDITERYIFKLDEVFAVCLVGRATTDAGVAAVLKLAKKARLTNVGIICTKSDEIQAEEAERDWKDQTQTLLKLRDLEDAVSTEEEKLNVIKAEIAYCETYKFDDGDDAARAELLREKKLNERRSKSERRLADYEFALKRYLVTTRNDIVTKELRRSYRSYRSSSIGGKNSPLTVFCVSNLDYWTLRGWPRSSALPLLELSNIPQVRKHCIAIVSEAQYTAADLYMSHKIPALLDSLQLWVESGSGGGLLTGRKEAIRNALEQVDRSLKGLMSSDWDLDENPMKQLYRTHVVQNHRLGEWTRSAQSAACEWSMMHHSSYSAFCRNYGDYCTPAAGSRNWNGEAIDSMARDLRGPWNELDKGVQEWQDYVRRTAESRLDHGIRILREQMMQIDGSALDSLVRLLKHRQRLLDADLEELCETEHDAFSQLERDALSSYRTSLIGVAMAPSYEACNMESGRGSDGRRKLIIKSRVGDGRLFEELARETKRRCWAVAGDLEAKMMGKMEEHMAEVVENMALLRDENVALESEREPGFRSRVQSEVTVVREAMGLILDGIRGADGEL